MVRLLSFIILLVPSVLSAQAVTDTTPRPIELDEAVRLARRNSPVAVQARGDLRVARAGIKSAYFAFLPDLSLSGGRSWGAGSYVNQGGAIEPYEADVKYSDMLFVRATLFDGGRRFFDIRSAHARSEAAEATDIVQEYQVTLDV